MNLRHLRAVRMSRGGSQLECGSKVMMVALCIETQRVTSQSQNGHGHQDTKFDYTVLWTLSTNVT
jgi:hypothetical protein